MAGRWKFYLERWTQAGLIDAATAEGIRAYEAQQERAGGLRWPVLLASGLGALLVGAGVLLFVAAHWEQVSPAQRFVSVLVLVGLFHLAGAALAERLPVFASPLHAVGTVCLGAGIFLSAQIFHLQEHWPTGVLLWALGAWVAWALLRDWPQAALVSLLTPMWLGGEWLEAASRWQGNEKILAVATLLLAFTYLSALLPGKESAARKTLVWIGGLALMPATLTVISVGQVSDPYHLAMPPGYQLVGWLAALALPLGLACWLRRGAAWMNGAATVWVLILGLACLPKLEGVESLLHHAWRELGPYLMCALGSLGLIAWGLAEGRRERLNLGVAGFALTVLFFYFGSVMDKLGRAASLVGLGVLFLLGGYFLEKARRRLMARVKTGAA